MPIKNFGKRFPEVEWIEVPCEGVAAAIEQGKDENFISALVQKAAKEYHALGIDTGYWACTHYPLVPDAFGKVFPGIPFIDPALPTVETGMAILERKAAWQRRRGRMNFISPPVWTMQRRWFIASSGRCLWKNKTCRRVSKKCCYCLKLRQ